MNLSAIHSKQNEERKAIEYQEKVLAMSIKLYGEDSAETANSCETLTRSYFSIEDYRKALAKEQVVYKFHKKNSGVDDEKTKNAALVLNTLTAKAVEKVFFI
jgi:tetratricopeptide (TPR) repeat protein